jgi:hypothetical protein
MVSFLYNNPIRVKCRGLNKMANFINHEYSGYKIFLLPNDNFRKLTRFIFRKDIVPYLNGSYLYFDIIVSPPNQTS